jgi:hypothetical protein
MIRLPLFNARAAEFFVRRDFGQLVKTAWATLRGLGPYALIELVLPGGTVLAVLCWLYRRRRNRAALAEAS